ncbi:uroporphyrinogen-III synthase [Noviherbaspirillum sp.]|uniref:uroporphyrinogen-III synthase n=1 Tax=Noviherbaspirillum sp. TaxID=1926288 RepID=UPI002B49EEA1|nr:uroporphyrinogen-III synthase [Noviherbaspirillum sp.]HJV80276.1 uroporphyrinogen-III synthase [Noviherbaspirillum sp.]
MSTAMECQASTTLLPASIVVTRPIGQAQSLSDRIAAMGLATTVFPLLDILPAPDELEIDSAASRLHDYAMVVFVSTNAVDAFVPRVAHWPDRVACAVVGDGTRMRLAQFGLDEDRIKIVSPWPGQSQDSKSLFARLDLATLRHRRVLIVRAESGRDYLARALTKNQVWVDCIAAYRRIAPEMDATRIARLSALLEQRHCWVMTSGESVAVLLEMAKTIHGLRGARDAREQHLLVSHHRIAASARSLGFARIITCGTGDDAIVACLRSLLERK